MKKLFLFATLIVASIFAVTSCGGSSDDKNKEQAETQDGVATLDDELGAVGVLDGYVELEKGTYKINSEFIKSLGIYSVTMTVPFKVIQPIDTCVVETKIALLDADKHMLTTLFAVKNYLDMLNDALKRKDSTVNILFHVDIPEAVYNQMDLENKAKYVIISSTRGW